MPEDENSKFRIVQVERRIVQSFPYLGKVNSLNLCSHRCRKPCTIDLLLRTYLVGGGKPSS